MLTFLLQSKPIREEWKSDQIAIHNDTDKNVNVMALFSYLLVSL